MSNLLLWHKNLSNDVQHFAVALIESDLPAKNSKVIMIEL